MAAFIYDEMVTTDQEMAGRRRIVVAVAASVEPGWVAAIKAVDDRLDVHCEPQPLPAQQFPGHGRGTGSFQRARDDELHWERILAEAEIVLGWPNNTAKALADLVRTGTGLRWVQTTVGGSGRLVEAAGLSVQELDRIRLTGVDVIQAGPLGEFAMFALLAFAKQLPPLRSESRGHPGRRRTWTSCGPHGFWGICSRSPTPSSRPCP